MPTPLDKMKVSVDKRVKLTDEDKKEIVRLRDEGWSWEKEEPDNLEHKIYEKYIEETIDEMIEYAGCKLEKGDEDE